MLYLAASLNVQKQTPSGLVYFGPAFDNETEFCLVHSFSEHKNLHLVQADEEQVARLKSSPYVRYVSDPLSADLEFLKNKAEARHHRTDLAMKLKGAERSSALQDIWQERKADLKRYRKAVRENVLPTIKLLEVRFGAQMLSDTVTDTFGRSDSSLHGSSTETGGRTWSVTASDRIEVKSNKIRRVPGKRAGYAWISGDPVGEQETEIALSAAVADQGVMTRWDGASSNGYLLFVFGSWGLTYLWKVTGGSLSHIGTASGTRSTGDVISLYSSGSGHSAKSNGTSILSAVTDSGYSEGVGGVYSNDETETGALDSFVFRTSSSGGGSNSCGLVNGGLVTGLVGRSLIK